MENIVCPRCNYHYRKNSYGYKKLTISCNTNFSEMLPIKYGDILKWKRNNDFYSISTCKGCRAECMANLNFNWWLNNKCSSIYKDDNDLICNKCTKFDNNMCVIKISYMININYSVTSENANDDLANNFIFDEKTKLYSINVCNDCKASFVDTLCNKWWNHEINWAFHSPR